MSNSQILLSYIGRGSKCAMKQCQEPFITRGSYHILSDKQKVGWHPEFQNRLKFLLEGKEVAD